MTTPAGTEDRELSELADMQGAVPPEQLCDAESIDERVEVVAEHSLPVRMWLAITSCIEWLFGLASLLVILAFIVAIPLLQFLSLGYLLEASGRIVRTGRFRAGFVGIRQVSQIGSLVLGTWLMLWPLRFLSDVWYTAQLMAPDGRPTIVLRVALLVLTSVFILHVLLAWYCGGKLRHFFWPVLAPFFLGMWLVRLIIASKTLRPIVGPVVGTFSKRLLNDLTTVPPLSSWFPPAIFLDAWRRGGLIAQARGAVWQFTVNLRLPYYYWLGLRGFFGGVAWLFVPAVMMIGMTKLPALATEAGADLGGVQLFSALGGLSGFFGTLLMGLVIVHLPFLQIRFAAENRLAVMFDVRGIWRMFARAPIAFWFALFVTLLFALPLYLLKIEYTPRELLWLPSLLFVVFIYPAKLITGWAVSRATKRESRRHWFFWCLAPVAAVPVVGFYVFILFFTQYVSWDGAWSLLEQHPFLLPAPFFGG